MSRPRVASLLVATLWLSACGTSAGNGTGQNLPGSQSQPKLSVQPVPVPSGMAAPGKLVVAADPTEAPLVYYDHNHRFAGFSIELLGQMASEMALELEVINIDGGQIGLGLADAQRRYDMGVASQPATPELSASEATLEYMVGGQAILAAADQGQITGLGSLCGLKVGANRGSAGETAVLRQNEGACHAKPITYAAYDDDVKGLHDVQAATLAAYVQDYAVATALARLYNNVRLVSHHFNLTPEVFLFSRAGTALREAAARALDRVRKGGAYQKLLSRWGLTEGAVN